MRGQIRSIECVYTASVEACHLWIQIQIRIRLCSHRIRSLLLGSLAPDFLSRPSFLTTFREAPQAGRGAGRGPRGRRRCEECFQLHVPSAPSIISSALPITYISYAVIITPVSSLRPTRILTSICPFRRSRPRRPLRWSSTRTPKPSRAGPQS